MLSQIVSALDRNGERYLLLVFYTMVVVVIGAEVVRRFLLSYSSVWGEEIARYCFIYLTWIGASAGIKNRTHIRIDLIYRWVPESQHFWLYLFADVATMVLAVVAFYYSLTPIFNAISFGNVTEGLLINRAYFLVAVPLGFAMTMFRLVQNMVRDIGNYRAGRPAYVGKKLFE